ncbi:HD family phosphohydrolase [Anaerofustis stercorihominis]|uniref:HDIG domain-containing protein n=1 Tax=Anaerofustis stercorihominis TaxID=214853 RepID=A0A3E3DUA6_9FIRM|nr:HDIG domain-containing metalloprotein [Anaerofustis stercorihominis]RGD72860.1 HDIG domain-containing protein [Anaerofustis stercorihominis]
MKHTKQKNKETNISIFFENMKTNRKVKLSIAIIFFILAFILTFISSIPQRYDLEVGQVASEDIIAPRKIVNTSLTNSLKDQAVSQTPNVYDYIPGTKESVEANLNKLFKEITNIKEKDLTDENIKIYNSKSGIDLTKETYQALIKQDTASLKLIQKDILSLLDNLYKDEVISDSMNTYYKKINKHYTASSFNHEVSEALKEVVKNSLKANMVLNEDATNQAKLNAKNAVEDITYEPGEVIIKKGDIITQNQINVLKEGSLIRSGIFDDYNSIIGIAAMLLFLMLVYILYLRTFHKDIFYNNKMLALISCQFLLMIVLAQLASLFNIYLIPVSIMSMTLCILLSPRIAINTNVFMVLFLSVALDINTEAIVFLLLSGFVGILYMQRVQERSKIYKAAIIVSAANMIIVLIYSILRNTLGMSMVYNIMYAGINGILSGVISMGMMLFWEYIFNILTPFKLLELSSPTNELMRKLITGAPGTYHHCLLVGNLAQEACSEIGANGLLARVGAYYHDIGKCEKPLFFSENQQHGNNPHDHLDPNVSVRIIKNHVSDGVYLANKYRLPREIIDFIKTHHGDALIQFFYYKEKSRGVEPDIKTYSYDGPKPTTIETSVVLLADGVEAAVKSLDTGNKEAIRAMIDKIVSSKIAAHQLDNSPLKMKDIDVIKKTFFRVLTGVYHERVQYPEQEKSINTTK